jgi:predicted amidophosphoribosyltransferase
VSLYQTGGTTGGRAPVTCPDCGKPVPPGTTKLCPRCGYPLMFDTSAPAEVVQPEYLHKPVAPERQRDSEPPPMMYPGSIPTVRPEMLGPHCPACRHRNPVQRVRCEICGQELWPGAASPPRRNQSQPSTVVRTRRSRAWVTVAVLLGVPVAAVLLMYLLSYALG